MQLNTTSGQGDATLSVTVAPNDVPAARNAVVTVNDQRLTISQEPRPCTYELKASAETWSAAGGRGSVAVNTLSGCAWNASSSGPWLRVITSSGNGAGSVEFEVAGNDGPARVASITIGGRAVTISQSAVEAQPQPPQPSCAAALTPTSINATAAGGTHTVSIGINPSCDWTATSGAPWVTFASPANGRGAATLTLSVARNTGSVRSTTVTVAQQTVTVNQAAAPACTVSIDPASLSFPFAGGEGRVRVTTQDGCEWTATGGASWTTITTGRGTGSGEARYNVLGNTTPTSRSTTLTIGGQSHSVTQQAGPPACTFSLDPVSRTFGAAGGEGRVTVNTQSGCQWSATNAPSWVSVSGSQNTGPGELTYTVQENSSSSSRSGAITIGGQTHAVNQDAASPTCTFTLQPGSRTFNAAGGEGRISVVTQVGCVWSASSGAPWATVATPNGTGPGDVVYMVLANGTFSSRSTSITVNGQTHGVTQDAAAPSCTFSVQPTSRNFGPGGGEGRFSVITQAGCSWSASSGAPWATLTMSSGGGPGDVMYAVQANPAPTARQTTISVNGQPHTVTQEAAAVTCAYSVQPASQRFTTAGGSGTFSVVTQPGCAWTAASGASWAIVNTPGGSGPGSVTYTVQANTGTTPRQTTISAGGQTHTVNQTAGDDGALQSLPRDAGGTRLFRR